jgi:uncharacterized tellurite resistance protein B-like protein
MVRMLDFLRKLLGDTDDAQGAVPAPQRAVAALLVEAAQSDGGYDAAEMAAVDAMLAALFGLDPAGAKRLRRDGEVAQGGAPDVVRFTRVVKTVLSEQERVAVIEALWAVVMADGVRHPREDALMRRLPPLLAVSDRDSAWARQRVIAHRQAADPAT